MKHVLQCELEETRYPERRTLDNRFLAMFLAKLGLPRSTSGTAPQPLVVQTSLTLHSRTPGPFDSLRGMSFGSYLKTVPIYQAHTHLKAKGSRSRTLELKRLDSDRQHPTGWGPSALRLWLHQTIGRIRTMKRDGPRCLLTTTCDSSSSQH